MWPTNRSSHRIAVTQIRLDGLGHAYYRKRLDAGASTSEALRSLKRRLARVVFQHLHTDHQTRNQPRQPTAA
jgi:transposase